MAVGDTACLQAERLLWVLPQAGWVLSEVLWVLFEVLSVLSQFEGGFSIVESCVIFSQARLGKFSAKMDECFFLMVNCVWFLRKRIKCLVYAFRHWVYGAN